jgi:hypothetical protein
MGNSLEGRDTLMASRIHQRPHLGEQLRTPIGAKAMGDLAKNHAPAQCPITGMIGRRHRLIVEEQQQMLLNSQVVSEKLLSLRGLGLQIQDLP